MQEHKRNKRNYSEIVEELLKYLPSVGSQEVLSSDCVGEILSEDIILKENYPNCFISKYDGYLCKGNSPFKLIKEIYPKDELNFSIEEGCCVFLATGSAVKEIKEELKFFKIEDVDVKDSYIIPIADDTKNNWIKPGSELKSGEKIFSRGKKISYKDKFALELLNIRFVKVFKRLNLSIINTGSELVNESDEPNVTPLSSWIIAPIAQFDGFNVIHSGPIADEEYLLEEILEENLNSDIILFIGSTGKGKRDLIRGVLNKKANPIFEIFNTPVGKNSYAYLCENKLILGFSGIIQASVALYYLILRNLIFKQRKLPVENLADFCDFLEKPEIGRSNWYKSENIESGRIILKKCNFLNSEFLGFYFDEKLFIQRTNFFNQVF
ncbi:Molybdopterin biosynthesis enzyme [Thermodesulfobium acidiphilum]|uniref:Molybdopterin molybdenumtransferase n=1 Tax=Thermodesulfobium acidiphilum TaxID=1794699 RepID=A0A2R4W0H6_THEAF|nr:molybdopterin-binding protein [Thermodesulfobium acidiphilum]AWB10252.1 Molybdopterin biosynthesis enzyme [Thermodesulfobium acidiphilum]